MTVPTPGDLAAPKERAAALWLLGFCLLISLLTYGFNLFDVRLSIDNEITGFADLTPTVWLAKGRWGTLLLTRFVLPHPTFLSFRWQSRRSASRSPMSSRR